MVTPAHPSGQARAERTQEPELSTFFDLPSPSRATVGAVGPPGRRVFYLQAGEPGRVVSFKLEKAQVLFLAGGLSEVLADLASPGELPDDLHLELEQPVEAEWAVGSMQLAYDPERDRVILVARELSEEEGEAGPGTQPLGVDLERLLTGSEPGAPGAARVMLTREQAAAMVRRGRELLAAGRPPCPLCGYPLEEDHSCPKTNGHRAPSL